MVFHYGIFPRSEQIFEDLGVRHHCLTTWWDVLEAAREAGHFDENTLDEVEKFLHDPESWSAAHGGRVAEG